MQSVAGRRRGEAMSDELSLGFGEGNGREGVSRRPAGSEPIDLAREGCDTGRVW